MSRRRTDTLDRPATAEEREALLVAVHGAIACHRCGRSIPGSTPPSAAIKARNGEVVAWSACAECSADVAEGSDAGAVLRVLGLTVDFANLAAAARVPLRHFASTWDAAPTRPAAQAWAHLDRDAMLDEFRRCAQEEARRTLAHPCGLCGVATHPRGPGPDGRCRGCCDQAEHAIATHRLCNVEDLAAANLAGMASPAAWPLHAGLAGLLGFTAFNRTPGAEPHLDVPFDYIDVDALRARAKALADDGLLRLPARWPLPVQPW